MSRILFMTLRCGCSPVYCSLHNASQVANKSLLSKLRKQTGFTFSLCKEALVKHENDFEKARQWLKEEAIRQGWAKAGKLAGRSMSDGLLGILATNTRAVIVEVNCETDFVSRNSSFQNLVVLAAETLNNHYTEPVPRKHWNSANLENMLTSSSSSLHDILVTTIGSVGENMSIRRAVGLCVPDGTNSSRLAVYSHVSSEGIKQVVRDVHFGKYAAVIRYKPLGEKPANDAWHERASRLGRQICQHIVGMNPRRSLELTGSPASNPDEEKCLLWQPFLLDETITVGEHLTRNEMVLEDFVRVECGVEEEEEEGEQQQVNRQQSNSQNSPSSQDNLKMHS